jgi:hypothetical protein
MESELRIGRDLDAIPCCGVDGAVLRVKVMQSGVLLLYCPACGDDITLVFK